MKINAVIIMVVSAEQNHLEMDITKLFHAKMEKRIASVGYLMNSCIITKLLIK